MCEKNNDTPPCEKCSGRTALVTGCFIYEPDAEPYKNGIEQKSLVTEGQCWVAGYICDDCGHIQGLWNK